MPYKIFQLIILCVLILNCSNEKKEISDISQESLVDSLKTTNTSFEEWFSEVDDQIGVDDDYYFEKNMSPC